MILRTTFILSTLALGVTGAYAKNTHAKVESFQHSGGRHTENHRTIQRWDNMYPGAARHSGSNHSQGYVRNSGPRFHGSHRDWLSGINPRLLMRLGGKTRDREMRAQSSCAAL